VILTPSKSHRLHQSNYTMADVGSDQGETQRRRSCSSSRDSDEHLKRRSRERKHRSMKRESTSRRRRRHRHEPTSESSTSSSDSSSSSSYSRSRRKKGKRKRKKKRQKRRLKRDKHKYHEDDASVSSASSFSRHKHKRHKERRKDGRDKDGDTDNTNTSTTDKLRAEKSAALSSVGNEECGKSSVTVTTTKNPPMTVTSNQPKGPLTQQQYLELQSQIREVVDPHTGRKRWMRGTGEIVERIVSRDEHLSLNKTATRGDGSSFARDIARAANRK
jgi:hypothetical protein